MHPPAPMSASPRSWRWRPVLERAAALPRPQAPIAFAWAGLGATFAMVPLRRHARHGGRVRALGLEGCCVTAACSPTSRPNGLAAAASPPITQPRHQPEFYGRITHHAQPIQERLETLRQGAPAGLTRSCCGGHPNRHGPRATTDGRASAVLANLDPHPESVRDPMPWWRWRANTTGSNRNRSIRWSWWDGGHRSDADALQPGAPERRPRNSLSREAADLCPWQAGRRFESFTATPCSPRATRVAADRGPVAAAGGAVEVPSLTRCERFRRNTPGWWRRSMRYQLC